MVLYNKHQREVYIICNHFRDSVRHMLEVCQRWKETKSQMWNLEVSTRGENWIGILYGNNITGDSDST